MFQKVVIALLISVLFQTVLVEGVLKCLQCDSDKDANCINDLSKIKLDDCGEKDEFCLTSIDDKGTVIRSCSDKDCVSKDNCTSSHKIEGGNKHNICQTCSSSTDANCAQSETAQKSFNKICEKEDTKCLVNIKDKNTERRCATAEDESNCKDTNTCMACSGGNCNGGLFPTNRLRCFQCDEKQTGCSNVIANSETIKLKACRSYDSNDECYIFAPDEKNFIRGCVSDASDNKCSTPGSNKLCYTCKTDQCNNKNYKTDQSLRCIQCTSSATDDKCKWGQNATDSKNCLKQIAYHQEEKCYIQIKDDIVQRGCLYDRDDDQGDCPNDAKCQTCDKKDGDGCNNKDKANHSCIICRSDENGDCYDNAEKIPGKECRNSVNYDERGCFRGKWYDVVIRGCLVDADERVEATCRVNKTEQCEFCLENDCNKMKTSAGQGLNIFSTLLILAIVLVVRNF